MLFAHKLVLLFYARGIEKVHKAEKKTKQQGESADFLNSSASSEVW